MLYAKAIEFAALTGKETVIDAYCGIGTIGLCAAGRAKQVIGVERKPGRGAQCLRQRRSQ